MNVGIGVTLVVAGSALGLAVVFGAWRRVPFLAALGLLGAAGAVVGAGALLVQDEASAAEWALTLVALAVLTPLHARLVFGRPGVAR
jgi:hypothetical protein